MQIFLDEILLTAPCCVHVVHIFRRSEKTSMMRNATWTLSNLCRGKPPPPFEWVQSLVDTRGCAAQHVCTDRNCFVRFEKSITTSILIYCPYCPYSYQFLSVIFVCWVSSKVSPALGTLANLIYSSDCEAQIAFASYASRTRFICKTRKA